MDKKENILVSACLLGVHCRYDGKCQNIQKFNEILPLLSEKYNLIPVCPEVYGELPTPRPPAEIKDGRVYNNQGVDVTEEFTRGAEKTLSVAREYNCSKAILKLRSPSCGNGNIYDGTFSKKIVSGDGITAKLLKDSGIEVFGENESLTDCK